ncbi:MAG: hypothetical protein FWD82_01835 [Defluviitaleaceae bacterium]|nr:hypothetical protein [Defluviitaleaceae bacterium]
MIDKLISVAIFMVLCVFVVMTVVYASNSRQRVNEIYRASMVASSSIEEFRALSSPHEFYDSDFSQTVIITRYFDKEFNEIFSDSESHNIVYMQEFFIYTPVLMGNSEDEVIGTMFNLRTSIARLNSDGTQTQLINYSAKKYFSNRG